MAKINFDLEDLTNAALKRLVKQLLAAEDGDEKKVMSRLSAPAKAPRNDLADLDEEMHGKPNTPEVEDDDEIEEGEELPPVPKKKGGRNG